MLCFATLFDSNYLAKGLALYGSLKTHVKDFKLFVLCLDDAAYKHLKSLNATDIHLLTLSEVEDGDQSLLAAKNNRSKVEYYFTLSPVLPSYILDHFKETDFITTLDADIYFFSDPSPVFDEFEGKSVMISPHKFAPNRKHQERYGLYNVSFQSFRNDDIGRACLQLWRDQCIDWCYDKLESDRFADQKYLDQWPKKFEKVAVLTYDGAALAPWNIGSYNITKRGTIVHANESPLVFYHFHGLKPAGPDWFLHGVDLYDAPITASLRDEVYRPYINELVRISSIVGSEATGHPLRIPTKKQGIWQILKSYSTLYRIANSLIITIDIRPLVRFGSKIKRLFWRK